MSAIIGIFYSGDRFVLEEDIQKMSDILSHRGSDAHNIWRDRYVALGHRMLWTTPESLVEKLPATSLNGNTIMADARIDNRS